MSDYNPGERRIVNRIKPPNKMPVLGIAWSDGYVSLVLGIVGVFVGATFGVGGFNSLLAGGIGVGIGLLLVYLSPSTSTVSTSEWLIDGVQYLLGPSRIYSASATADSSVRNEGGLKNKTPFAPDSRTEDYVGIERAWTDSGVILRADGRMEAALEIDAPNMQFATDDDWTRHQTQGKRAANDLFVSYPEVKLYTTTEPFDMEAIINDLEDRLTDPDIQHRDVFRELIREYKEHRPRELQDRGIQRIRTFLIVTVEADQAATEYSGDRTPKEKLANLPVIGVLLPSGWRGELPQTKQEMYEEMAETAHERLDTIRTDIYKEMEGHSVRRVSTIEMVRLAAEFWNGNKDAYQEIDDVIRKQPVMRAASDVSQSASSNPRKQSAYTDGGQ